jgi:hypothetical protein
LQAEGGINPVFGNVHELTARQLHYALTRAQHRADAIEPGLQRIDKRTYSQIALSGFKKLIHQTLLRIPFRSMRLAFVDQFLRQFHP